MAGQIFPQKIWLAGSSHFKSVLNKRPEIESLRSSFSLYAQFISQYFYFLYFFVSLKMLNIWTPGLSLKLPRIAIFRAFNLRAEKTDYCKKKPSVFPFDHSILFSPSLTLFLVTFLSHIPCWVWAQNENVASTRSRDSVFLMYKILSKHGTPLNSFLIISLKTFLRSRVSNFVFSIKLKFSWKG